MDATREIYWNVGRGAIGPMYAVALVALALLGWGGWRLLATWRKGRPVARLDRLPARLAAALRDLVGQGRVLRGRGVGRLHAALFWSFLVLFLGTLLVMLQADLTEPLLGWRFLQGGFYLGYSLVLDLAGLVAVVALAALLVRRALLARRGVASTPADWLPASLLLAILLTGFMVEGTRMAATELSGAPTLARWSPVGLAAAALLAPLGEGDLRALHGALWWGHLVLAAGFIAVIPFTRLRHLIAVPASVVAASQRPRGQLTTLDLEAEGATFGASTAAELAWKDLLDADACTDCRRCEERCPAHTTGKPLSPRRLVQTIGHAARTDPAASLVDAVGKDAIWSCTSCYACEDVCPAGVEHPGKIVELRRHLTLMEGDLPGDEVRTAAEQVEVNGNPLGYPPGDRAAWAEGLDLPVAGDGTRLDLLYFAGCYASYDRRSREVARAFVKICRAAGLEVGILGTAERCCGEPVRRLGNEYLYQALARENVEAIKASGAARVVTTCPHCQATLGRDYRDLGLDLPVEHHTELIARLVAGGRLPLAAAPFTATFHDPCTLARQLGVVEPPRAALRAAGATVIEMPRHGRDGFCCGAGGGRILAEERLGARINVARAEEARGTGAPLVVSGCPFCLAMLEDGIKAGGGDSPPRARDLAEVVADRIGGGA
ncbi:MAG TPA: (Fe-S)-binding protein [Anaeromyxobacteraceae bacterium]|nr:(Fe-S)-binding protein [Anaeromyxobacteraceae bacterium]